MNVIPAPVGFYALRRSAESPARYLKSPIVWMGNKEIPLSSSLTVRYWDIEGQPADTVLHAESGLVCLVGSGGGWATLEDWLLQA